MSIRPYAMPLMALGVVASLGTAAIAAEQKPYQIALSNSYIGNQWRIESINLANAYAKRALKDRVVLTVVSSGIEVQKQIAVMNDMISRHVDAILVNPASEHGLDAVIAQATAQGIPVIVFDHPVSSPDAYRVHVDFAKFGEIQAQWLADALHGKGDIIMNRGVAGIGGDKEIYDGAMSVLKKYPDIHVVAEVFGKWDDTVSETEVTKALIAHPKVDGVLNSVLLKGNAVGQVGFYGRGAGGDATASAVVADLADAARLLSADARHFVPPLAFQPEAVRELPLVAMKDVESAHYLRLLVADEAGVLSRITAILASHDISVEAIIQREPRDDEDATLAIITSVVKETKFNEALAEMQKLPFVRASVSRFRVEHFDD